MHILANIPSLAIKFFHQSGGHAFEQESILHFVLHPPPSLPCSVMSIITRYISRGEETNREWRKITNVEGEKMSRRGNFFPLFSQKSMQIKDGVAPHIHARGYLWGPIFDVPNLCARVSPIRVYVCVLEKIYRGLFGRLARRSNVRTNG